MMHKAWSSIEEVPYYFWGSSVKFLVHTAQKIVDFDPNWAFPDCNSSFNSPMGTKWCTKLEVAQKRCPIVLQGHPSNFTVTRAEKLTIWIQFEITRPVADIKSLRFALFEVIHQISRSHRLKNWQFQSNLSKITRPVLAIKFLRFALFKGNSRLWASLWKNRWMDFHEIFKKVRTWDKERSGTFWGCCG